MMVGRWIRGRFAGVSRKKFLAGAGVIYVVIVILITGCAVGISGGGVGTLDGSAWLSSAHPGDAAGISWLKENAGPSDVVAEAAGTSYNYSSRVSAMTGLTTPLGWAGHESGWRSGTASVGEVMSDLQQMYENPGKTLSLMDKYNVKYLFVGEVERAAYDVSLPKSGLSLVFSADGIAIYQRVY